MSSAPPSTTPGRPRLVATDLDGTLLRTDGSLSPPEQAARNERLMDLAAALVGLPEGQREAVELRYLHGWPVQRIAEHLERPAAAVAGLLHRGLARLRERLRSRPEPE